MIKKLLFTLCSATVVALWAPAMAAPAVNPGQDAFPSDYLAPGQVGVGRHAHRFVLHDPETGKVMPHARYRLLLKGHEVAGLPKSLNGIVLGMTDSGGRTTSVHFPKRYPRADWTLTPLIGMGYFGGGFILTGPEGGVLANFPYIVDVEDGYLFCGKSDDRGGTYYLRSNRERALTLFSGAGIAPPDFAWCKRSAEAIASLPADAAAPAIFQSMLAQYASAQGLSEELRVRIEKKLIDLAFSGRDSKQLDSILGLVEKVDHNAIGYRLINTNWMVERGLAHVEKALAEDPDEPNALDSKGWGLFRLGQSEQALIWFDRAIAAYGAGTEMDAAGRAETLVHKGEALWQLGRKAQARAIFAAARELDDGDKIVTATLTRLRVDMEGEGEQPGAGVAPSE